ncbi:hypothetical protein [Motiliproteus sp. MSK22-1]|uniref:hypothetical protein n=1 Tax=Motiliproteus sp. MSK22-1 TaxID=1897630 RepID=UPI0009772D1E|nr:hypothetical protein [Motiliproteus sp. MSK22-1]OMH36191.1 hypothetical protein BGP75_10140 [Motiliproteus sp. MSK22-1]
MDTKKTVLARLTLSVLTSVPVMANDWKGEAKGAWLDGEVETANGYEHIVSVEDYLNLVK